MKRIITIILFLSAGTAFSQHMIQEESLESTSSFLEARNRCADILRDGVFEIDRVESRENSHFFLGNHLCNTDSGRQDDKIGGDISLLLRVIGVEFGGGYSEYRSWFSRNCDKSDNDYNFRHSKKQYTKKVSTPIVDAWLQCMSLTKGKDDWALSPEIETKKAILQIAVLGRAYHWKLASTKTVIFNDGPVNMLQKFSNSYSWKRSAHNAVEILAVGTASCGIETTTDREEKRAEQRAAQLMDWMLESGFLDATQEQARKYINLGIFKDAVQCSEGSSSADKQRPIIVILVKKKKDINTDSDYDAALREAATKHYAFPKLSNYSKFAIQPF